MHEQILQNRGGSRFQMELTRLGIVALPMAVHPQNGTLEPDGATLVHSARFTHSCTGARSG
jgi:hypothetical protein